MRIETRFCSPHIHKVEDGQELTSHVHRMIQEKTAPGGEFLGWLDYADKLSEKQICEIEEIADEIRQRADVLVISGIGGSYLGSKAVMEALCPTYGRKPEIIFMGHHMSSEELVEVTDYICDKEFYVLVISKSGKTLEPAISFRLLRRMAEERYGGDSSKRIIAITDEHSGALRTLASQKNYRTFSIPADIGGRYSVHTPAGLLPMAVAGLDIRAFLEGMKEGSREYSREFLEENAAYRYALMRSRLLEEGKHVEILVNYHPKLMYFAEWFKQLFGESEGKENKGIFPVAMINTTDLHSLGQYVQEGQRILFETVIDILKPKADIFIPGDEQDLDELNYLYGRDLHFINRRAMQATALAHMEGGVPNIIIEVDKLDERNLGKLMYFFMIACAAGGLFLGVNPFNQPGVEAYKNNMFALLGKPGMEIETAEIEKKIHAIQEG